MVLKWLKGRDGTEEVKRKGLKRRDGAEGVNLFDTRRGCSLYWIKSSDAV